MPRGRKKKRQLINVSDDDISGAESIATIGGSDFSCTDSDSDYLPPSNKKKKRSHRSSGKKKRKSKRSNKSNNNNNNNNNNNDNAPKLTKEQQQKLDREREIETGNYYDREEDCIYTRSDQTEHKSDKNMNSNGLLESLYNMMNDNNENYINNDNNNDNIAFGKPIAFPDDTTYPDILDRILDNPKPNQNQNN